MARQQEYLLLKLGDIKGQATTLRFEDKIVPQNRSYGICQGGSWEEGAQLSGRVTTFLELSGVKLLDVSSHPITTACAMKQQYPKAEISVTAGTKAVYYKLTLEKSWSPALRWQSPLVRAIRANRSPSVSVKRPGNMVQPKVGAILGRTRRSDR